MDPSGPYPDSHCPRCGGVLRTMAVKAGKKLMRTALAKTLELVESKVKTIRTTVDMFERLHPSKTRYVAIYKLISSVEETFQTLSLKLKKGKLIEEDAPLIVNLGLEIQTLESMLSNLTMELRQVKSTR